MHEDVHGEFPVVVLRFKKFGIEWKNFSNYQNHNISAVLELLQKDGRTEINKGNKNASS